MKKKVMVVATVFVVALMIGAFLFSGHLIQPMRQPTGGILTMFN